MHISKEFKIGLFSIVSIALLYLGFNFLKGIDFFSSSNKYYAVYKNIDGLQVSNSVIINGLAVGRVSDIDFLQNEENKIVVELDIEGDILLDDSTTAFLISEGFLGGKAIELRIPGEIRNPLQDGDTLRSDIAMGLIESITEQTLPVANDAGALIRKLNAVLDSLVKTELEIRGMIGNVNQTLELTYGIVEDNRSNLKTSFENIRGITMQLNESTSVLKDVLSKTDVFIDSLNNLEMSQAVDNIALASESLHSLMSNLENGEGTAGRLLNDDSLYLNLNKSAEDLDKLLIDLRENPKRYVHFSLFGRKDKSEK